MQRRRRRQLGMRMVMVAVAVGLQLRHRHGGGGREWIQRDYEKILRRGSSRRLKLEGMYFSKTFRLPAGDEAMSVEDPTLLAGAGTRLRLTETSLLNPDHSKYHQTLISSASARAAGAPF